MVPRLELHLSELETCFSFVDALIISRSMLVELHLPLNCHLTVVRDLTSQWWMTKMDVDRNSSIIAKNLTSGITRSVRPYPLVSNPVPSMVQYIFSSNQS